MPIQKYTVKSMDKKKNVLFILHLPPPVHGSSLVGATIKDSKLINESFDCRYINLLVSRTVYETGKPSVLKVFRFVGVWVSLLLEIAKKRPDICYLALTATGAAFYKDVLLVAVLRLFRIKRIYHLHNKGVSKNQSSRMNTLLYRFVFTNADIILLSKHLYSDIQAFVSQERIFICPNGIVDTHSNPVSDSLNKERPVQILFLSNLIESKGVSVLLDACAILHQQGIDFTCNFVGAEGDMSTNQFNDKVIEKQLSGRVNYLGKKFGADKQEIIASADIFAFPTYYSNECFPLVLLEAMCDGLPIVTTFEGGIPDMIKDGINGYLVPQKNAAVLAERLLTLIQDPALRNQMGIAGRQKFEMEFTVAIFENRMVRILKKLLNK